MFNRLFNRVEIIARNAGYNFRIEQSFWDLVKEIQERNMFTVKGRVINLRAELETDLGAIYSLYLYSVYLWRHGQIDFAIMLGKKFGEMVDWTEYSEIEKPVFLEKGDTTIEMSRIEYYKYFQIIHAAEGNPDAALVLALQKFLESFPEDVKYTKNMPVFSFRRCSEYTFKDLENKAISVTCPTEMNDPWDCLFHSINNLHIKEISDRVRSQFKDDDELVERYTAFLEVEKDVLKYCRIRSFVSGESDDAIQNRLLWSHYADSWKGFCVKYSLSPYFRFSRDRYRARMMRKIDYSDSLKKINPSKVKLIDSFFRKEEIWKYENEYRLLTFAKYIDDKYEQIPLDDESYIEAVYFGINCSEENKEKIKSLLSYDHRIRFIDLRKDDALAYQTHQIHEYRPSEESVRKLDELFGK